MLDFFFAVLGVMFLSPLLIAISITVKVDSKGPVFFNQKRVGKNAEVFTIIKFRSMTEMPILQVEPSRDMMRMTRAGHFIRTLSLDELPQLCNIMGGKMSFIGPRPLLTDYLSQYTPEQFKRHLVMPGISGWAQVNGRNGLNWETRFKYDVWYVQNISFMLDLKILFMTLRIILNKKGINSSVGETMPLFIGNNKSVTS